MTDHNYEDQQKKARMKLLRKQARRDPVCAEYLGLMAENSMSGATAFIETVLDSEEDEDDFRPY